ncbi:TPA: type IV secretion system protein [Stenotrophomonas maltophilia]
MLPLSPLEATSLRACSQWVARVVGLSSHPHQPHRIAMRRPDQLVQTVAGVAMPAVIRSSATQSDLRCSVAVRRLGLVPSFILCLLFEYTKALFQKWHFYGVATMLPTAVLSAMILIALDMVIRVSASFWASALIEKFLLDPEGGVNMTSQALQQGGMGLILTTLILTAPPMAAMFFQGTMGSFMAYSQIGGSPVAAAPGPNGQPPGSYSPSTPASTNSNIADGSVVPRMHAGNQSSPPTAGQMGKASSNS